MNLVANARMYALTPSIRDLWANLFAWVAQQAGEPLTYIDHAAPAALDTLWQRSDLGAAFACGYPFALGTFPIQPLAAPVPAGERYCGRPVYATDLVVRADGTFYTLADTFGGRIGWTVEHSQSGFNAVRAHLATYRRKAGGEPLYREAVGPLVTPRRVIEALLDGRIDVGPLDSYAHDLLVAHEPETASRLRIVESTPFTPMPLLVSSEGVPPQLTARLRSALFAAGASPTAAPILRPLCLSGFASADLQGYRELTASADVLQAEGYATLT
jgi:ABC-type phosphate/phosphonate transport system substrate-binding protein